MNKSQVATLLGLAAATDNRTVGEADVAAWQAIITQALGEDVRFEDCRWALIEHYGQSRDYLTPIHIVELVKKLRRTRRLKIPLPPAPAELVDDHGYPDRTDPQKWAAFQAWRDPIVKAIENGTYMPDPPPDVVRRSITEVEEADAATARMNSWERWLDSSHGGAPLERIEPWPGVEQPSEVEDGRKPRDMSFVDEIADAKSV